MSSLLTPTLSTLSTLRVTQLEWLKLHPRKFLVAKVSRDKFLAPKSSRDTFWPKSSRDTFWTPEDTWHPSASTRPSAGPTYAEYFQPMEVE